MIQMKKRRNIHPWGASGSWLIGLALTLTSWIGACQTTSLAGEPASFSGIYPHLATFNDETECGTGAVVPWADRLWVISYAPHKPNGSSDKLYEITPDLQQIIHPESVGGTPANRMIHAESKQLFIGPYVIDADRRIRVLSPKVMPGRLTGAARHLTDPSGKIYLATMEEGFYEVDVQNLSVRTLYPDIQDQNSGLGANLPGYHGKGLYSGQGVLVYANNGERSAEALRNPKTTSGSLSEWDGKTWRVIRRNQFTEVTGPGGLAGNRNPGSDPVWSIGWDHRSLILMLRDQGIWHGFRLPKASHCYDGAHGWNTEWPRIRNVGTGDHPDFLMTMHGMFWRFPETFSAGNRAGIRPRSSYLKVIGDFCRWDNRLVFGCDDTAKSEFLNSRKAKGRLAAPGQSQSNLWFTDPNDLDTLGPTTASGAVWLQNPVKAGEYSEPFLFAGWDQRSAFLVNDGDEEQVFELTADHQGNGQWRFLRQVAVPRHGSAWLEFAKSEPGEWIRVRALRAASSASIVFTYSQPAASFPKPDARFNGLATVQDADSQGGLLLTAGNNRRTLLVAAMRSSPEAVIDAGDYELGTDMVLRPVGKNPILPEIRQQTAIPRNVWTVDKASVLVVDDQGRRWRLPKGDPAFDSLTTNGLCRLMREVCTERDLFNCHGTFYELPAENADGFAKVRPIASHNLRLMDYCSYRGLLILTGIRESGDNPHMIRSQDGQAAIWAGAIDDLWRLGKPVGRGGPWKDSEIKAGIPSDPYLCAGYSEKCLELSHQSSDKINVIVEADPTGAGPWIKYQTVEVPPGKTIHHRFPPAFQARWLRFSADRNTQATACLIYQ